MLNLRLKQAETAWRDGRLDEAFELADNREIRKQRRGQELIGKLARSLTARGGEHLEQNRTAQALSDCRKAEKLAGHIPEVAALKQAIAAAANGRQQATHKNGEKLARAREHIEQGWLSSAERLLLEVQDDQGRSEALKENIACRRHDMETARQKAREALDRNDLAGAFGILSKCGKAKDQRQELAELLDEAAASAVQQLGETLIQGRLDLTRRLMDTLAEFMASYLKWQELVHIYQQIHYCSRVIQAGEFRAGLNRLRQLQQILPGADWLDKTVEHTEKAATAQENLQASPLGWVMPPNTQPDVLETNLPTRPSPSFSSPTDPPAMSETPAEFDAATVPDFLPRQFVMQIDGVGSFLIMTQASVSIGPISAGEPADIGLVAGPDMPQVTIERMDEDYFVSAEKAVRVGGTTLKERGQKLLGGNERIELTHRCHLAFQRPNAASTTAKIRFDGARYPNPDIREAILMDREIIIGPRSTAHIRHDRISETLALIYRDGRLTCRTEQAIEIDGKPVRNPGYLPMEQAIKIGDISMVIIKR